MAGGRLAMTAVLAASGALGGALRAQPGRTPARTPFGASVAVHIARVGHIEVDLDSSGGRPLARVRCVGAAVETVCFVAR